jgi:hypothetical protein
LLRYLDLLGDTFLFECTAKVQEDGEHEYQSGAEEQKKRQGISKMKIVGKGGKERG